MPVVPAGCIVFVLRCVDFTHTSKISLMILFRPHNLVLILEIWIDGSWLDR